MRSSLQLVIKFDLNILTLKQFKQIYVEKNGQTAPFIVKTKSSGTTKQLKTVIFQSELVMMASFNILQTLLRYLFH